MDVYAGYLLTPLVYSLPFMLLPAWFIVRVGLRPLRTLADAIGQRSASDLTALPQSPYRELAPLTGAINTLMARLAERLAREREFLGDAAHELKTPLSVIQINAQLLASHCTTTTSERARKAGDGLRDGVARATRTVHQLLALERARAEHGDDAPRPLDLLELLRERLAQAAPLALQRAVDIELATQAACVLPLHDESIIAMLDNVIDNAIRYSPDGGRIAVALAQTGRGALLSIADQGPGVAPALRRKVFERFYRIPGQDSHGSGLGLSIAERAAARNGATIRLEDGPDGRGLKVIVEFCSHPDAMPAGAAGF